MIFDKCDFCEKLDFENVNFVKNGTFKMLLFGLIEDFCPSLVWTGFFIFHLRLSVHLIRFESLNRDDLKAKQLQIENGK